MRALGEPNIAGSTVTSVAPSALSSVLSLPMLQVSFLSSYVLELKGSTSTKYITQDFPLLIELWQGRHSRRQ